MSKEKNKKLKLFDIARDGKGISKKTAYQPSGIQNFFSTFKENFWKLLYVNIIMVIGNFPLVFLIATLAGFTKQQTLLPFFDVFQNLNGIYSVEGASPSMMSMMALLGVQNNVFVPTAWTYVFYGISALTLITFGLVNVGTAYVLRNIAKGDPVFVWSDFWYAIKRNLKQALIFGIFDCIINAVLIFNLYSYITAENFVFSFIFWTNLIIFLIFFAVRPYVYIQMVTFKLSIFKQLKNALIFSLLGVKRNLMALLGILLVLLLEILFIFAASGILIPLAVTLALIVLFSGCAYMKVFAAYYKIKEIMIDPYLAEHPEENPEPEYEEPIMHDDVTERERLEEIKRKNGITE